MGVGMLLYLVKDSGPDISNSVRELSMVAYGATEAYFKALLRTIKYVLKKKVYSYSQSLAMMVSICKEYLIVNMLEIRTHKSVSMVMSYTFVVHQ
jgi:hypothetical protein